MPTLLIGTYGDLEPSRYYARAQAGTYQPNLLASFCIFAAAVIARADAELPMRLRRITAAALWLTVALTFSRGILAFALAAAVRAARTKRQRWLVGIYTLACVVLLASLSIWNFSFNPTRPLEAGWEVGTLSSRRQAAASSWETLIAHPLLGSGLGTSPGHYRGITFDAHLTPLNIAATMGLPALISFVAVPIILWRRRSRPTDLALWGGLAGLALDALAQDIEDFRHLWVIFGLAAAANAAQSQQQTASAPAPLVNLDSA